MQYLNIKLSRKEDFGNIFSRLMFFDSSENDKSLNRWIAVFWGLTENYNLTKLLFLTNKIKITVTLKKAFFQGVKLDLEETDNIEK